MAILMPQQVKYDDFIIQIPQTFATEDNYLMFLAKSKCSDSLNMLSIKMNFYFRRKSILPISLGIFNLITPFFAINR